MALDSAVTKWKRNLGKRFDAPSSKRTTVEKRLLRICSTRLLDNVFKFVAKEDDGLDDVAKEDDGLDVGNILNRFEEENFEDLANVFHISQSDLGAVADGEWEKRNATVTMMSDEIASLLDSALPPFFSSLKDNTGERPGDQHMQRVSRFFVTVCAGSARRKATRAATSINGLN